jgi:hypothetical protein
MTITAGFRRWLRSWSLVRVHDRLARRRTTFPGAGPRFDLEASLPDFGRLTGAKLDGRACEGPPFGATLPAEINLPIAAADRTTMTSRQGRDRQHCSGATDAKAFSGGDRWLLGDGLVG